MKPNKFWKTLQEKLKLPFNVEDVTNIEENAGSFHIETTSGIYFLSIEKCEDEEGGDKEFLCIDMSGRGGKAPYTLNELMEMNDEDNEDHFHDNGETMANWAEFAEVGEEVRKGSEKFVRVK